MRPLLKYVAIPGAVAFAVTAGLVLGINPWNRMMAFKALRYESGVSFKGAGSCKACHRAIYEEWHASFSAVASHDPLMLLVRDRQPLVPNRLMMGEPCYACHGPKALDEGISCEVCHGANDRADVMEVHEKKYRPGRVALRNSERCGSCHEAIHPLTQDAIITTMQEWRSSRAAHAGIGCVDCHMRRAADGHTVHGRGGRRTDPSIYRDAVDIRNARCGPKGLDIDVENKITGHYLPTGGPEPALIMELSLLDGGGTPLRSLETAFQRKSQPVMAFPGRTVSDNRLRDGEIRTIHFDVHDILPVQLVSVQVTLRFVDIDFLDVGDVKKARITSAPFYKASLPIRLL